MLLLLLLLLPLQLHNRSDMIDCHQNKDGIKHLKAQLGFWLEPRLCQYKRLANDQLSKMTWGVLVCVSSLDHALSSFAHALLGFL